jgi:hypothetical protein
VEPTLTSTYAPRRGALGSAASTAAVLAASVAAGVLAAEPGGARIALAAIVTVALIAIGLRSPRMLLYALVVWLAAAGFVRRVTSVGDVANGYDPFVLVGALGIGVLLVVGTARAGGRGLSGLAQTVLILQILILLSAANPAQGGLEVGAAGLLLVLVPTLGFWIGRALVDDRTLRRLLVLVVALAVPTAVYGLVQTYSGFPSWDASWIQASGYAALNVGDATKPFGPFPSASEYALFVALGLVVAFVLALPPIRARVALWAVPLLAVAMFLASARGIVFASVGALALIAAAWRRLPLAGAVVLGVVAIVLVPSVVGRLAPSGDSGQTGALVQHQVSGLSNPFDTRDSTALIHLSMITDGIRSAVSAPAGVGVGSVTLAAERFGGTARTTEADPSNLAVALGAPGFVAYVVLLLLVVGRAYTLAVTRRDALSLGVLGLLVVTALQWFNGGQYTVALLIWLAMGWLDRARTEAS